jgi:hypothetical protein
VEYTYDAQGRMSPMKTWQDYACNSGTVITSWTNDAQRGCPRRIPEYRPIWGRREDNMREDERHMRAAEGWLDLDDPAHAAEELEQTTAEFRSHPMMLLLCCRIYLATNRPDTAHLIAKTFTEYLPEVPDGWFYPACACARLNQSDEAGAALNRCFVAAAEQHRNREWQERAFGAKELDEYWREPQREL